VTIVCGIDRSAAARAAARLGSALAGRLGLELVLAHAVTSGPEGRALALLTVLRDELEAPGASLHVRAGHPADVLAAAAADPTLIAVGGAPGVRRGGVRTALARRSPCPVAVVPAVPRLGGAEVLCGVRDRADVATAAVAGRLAAGIGLPLTLLHVLPNGPAVTGPGLLDRPGDHDGAERMLDAVARTVPETSRRQVAYGSAAHVLTREAAAREVALLVIGGPAYGRLGAALTGSAASHLLHRTCRPLVVCPGQRSAWPVLVADSAWGSW
jgi:nucleotide-binding universal stress UspA family protein